MSSYSLGALDNRRDNKVLLVKVVIVAVRVEGVGRLAAARSGGRILGSACERCADAQ